MVLNEQGSMVAVAVLMAQVSAEQCTVCPDGEPISRPEYRFVFEGAPVEDCAALSNAAGTFEVGTPFCDTIHGISSLCGCSYDEGSACSLCGESVILLPLNHVAGHLAEDYIFGAPPNVTLNCETLEAILHRENKESDRCFEAQVAGAHFCGCPNSPDQNMTTSEPHDDNVGNSDQEDDDVSALCTICTDGEPISKPDKPLLLDGFPIETCSDLGSFVGFLALDSMECVGLQSIGTYCGCNKRTINFSLCPSGADLPDPQRRITWLEDFTDIPEVFQPLLGSLTCGLFEAALQNYDEGFINVPATYIHFLASLKSSGCGCKADWRARLFIFSYRFSGSLSLIGSLLICIDVLWTKRKRKSTYHQLVLLMSMFDMISSVAYLGSSSFSPTSSGVYQAAGSDATCKLQGFMVQLGLTSVIFNAILAVYFFLMVNRNWKERAFVKFRHWVYVCVALLGTAMSVAGLWFYESLVAICYVAQPPLQSWLPLTLLFTVPMSITLVIGTISIILVCHKVYAIEWKAMKWSTRSDARLSKKVFRQTLLYMTSLYVTVPWLLLSFYVRDDWGGYWMFLVGGFMIPLQGFLNLFVYCNREKTIVSTIFSQVRRRWQSCSRWNTTLVGAAKDGFSSSEPGGGLAVSGNTAPSAEQIIGKVASSGKTPEQLVSEKDVPLSPFDFSISSFGNNARRRHTFDPQASATAVQEFLAQLHSFVDDQSEEDDQPRMVSPRHESSVTRSRTRRQSSAAVLQACRKDLGDF